MRLPEIVDPAFFDRTFRLDHAAWRSAVVEVCGAHDLAGKLISAFSDGSNLVAAVDDRWIVKIFPPFHRHQWESERRVLAHLRGVRLPLRVPALIAEGQRNDGWLYVVMEKLEGETLEARWGELDASSKARLLEQVGVTMATIHRLPLGELASLPPEWSSFLEGQKGRCRERHRRFGVPAWFEAGLEDFLSEWAPAGDAGDRALLTGEYTPFNLLVARDESGWQLSGMIDFGDAMVGPRDYDLLGPSMFSGQGDAELVAALQRGYFGEERPWPHATRLRLMALALLHRYANFDAQLRIPGWRERADSFEALAELVWPSR